MLPTVLGATIQPTHYYEVTRKIQDWACALESRYIIAANVHVVMESHDADDFREVVNRADLVTPDGMPLVWMLRLKGYPGQERVYGPTLMLHTLSMAVDEDLYVGFYGGKPEVIERLCKRMSECYPGLKIAYAYSPPFRPLTNKEDEEVIEEINKSGVQILFVGLGCPKQERWIADHRGKIRSVMVGVGAAFDFHSGFIPQAPLWIQRIGFEWLFRLIIEPRRLWKRYLFHNTRFVFLACKDLFEFFYHNHVLRKNA